MAHIPELAWDAFTRPQNSGDPTNTIRMALNPGDLRVLDAYLATVASVVLTMLTRCLAEGLAGLVDRLGPLAGRV